MYSAHSHELHVTVDLSNLIMYNTHSRGELHVTTDCLTTYIVHFCGELSGKFLWLHITLKWFTVGLMFVGPS